MRHFRPSEVQISDGHAIEHEFFDIQPTIAGIRLSLYFDGTAVLQNDGMGLFFVSSIVIGGTTEDMSKPYHLFAGRPRKSVPLVIKRPAAGDHSEEAVLFRLIANEVENDADALKAWQQELVA